MTAIACPDTLVECEVWIYRTAHMASFTGWRPPVDLHDSGTRIAGDPFQNGYKLCESEIRDLTPPQTLHSIEVQVFNADDGIFPDKLICQFEEPIASAVADTLVYPIQIADCPSAVLTAFATTGYRTMGSTQFIKG